MSETSQRTESATRSRVWALMQTEVFRLPPRKTWPGVIDEAGLPGEVGGRVREIVRRTRLWNRERVEVARELIAHARDALDSGVSSADAAEGLGEARVVAKLIRRAMRRKRPLLWHARVWMLRSVAGVVGLVLLVVGGVVGRTFVGNPEPSHSYIADLNAPLAELGEDEKAWPLYKDAYWIIQQGRYETGETIRGRVAKAPEDQSAHEIDIYVGRSGLQLFPDIDPAHPDYDALLSLLDEIQPALELVKNGAAMPAVGRLYSSKMEEYTDQGPGWLAESIPEPEGPAEQPMLFNVLLPHLSPMRTFAKWLAFDARVAVRGGDGARAVGSLRAVHGLARQVEQEPFLISYLVAAAVDSLALATADWAISEHPEVFSREDLVMLAHAATNARHKMPASVLRGEQMVFEDVLQHTFTDDGNGDGYITNEGIRGLRSLDDGFETPGPGEASEWVRALSLAPRAEQLRAYREFLSLVRADADAGYAVYRGRPIGSAAWGDENADKPSLGPIGILAPSFGKTLHTQNRLLVRLDTTLAAIAMELFRRDTEAWPGSLNELVPRYLPSAPEDPFDGEPLRLAFGEDGPVIYSIGPDGEDCGGVAGELVDFRISDTPESGEPASGDWVLYPPSAKN